MTLNDWLYYHEKNVVYQKAHWMGVPIVKNPLDAWIYQELIYKLKPDAIVEIGSYKGGSTFYFAHLLELIGRGKVISVDIDRTEFQVSHPRICAITGDSGSAEVLSKVYELCRGGKVMVVHDGCHEKEKVLEDLRNYSPLVNVGSYFIVEDSIYDLFHPSGGIDGYAGGPSNAITAFLKENASFEPDLECERYILTNHPRGFLKRIR